VKNGCGQVALTGSNLDMGQNPTQQERTEPEPQI